MQHTLKETVGKIIQNPNYIFLLAVINGAAVMNFHRLIYANERLLYLILLLLAITIVNYKKWWAALANCCILIALHIFAFPRIANHSVVILFISLALWLLFGLKLFRIKLQPDPNFISYCFRIVTVCIYFYTGFHKLNTDFFNPCVSCVNQINEYTISNILRIDFRVNALLSRFFQISSLFIEMVIPFGLLWHKTRKYAVIVLLLFHTYLSLSVFADFSAVALILLLGSVHNFNGKEIPVPLVKGLRIYLVFIILSITSYIVLRLASIRNPQFFQGVLFAIGYLVFIYTYFKTMPLTRFYFRKSYILPLAAVIVVISFWTLKTYIGLGNSANLTMFSNLVTEKERNNHLLIDTRKTKIFDFEEDSVYIIYLDKWKYNGYKLAVVEFSFLANNLSRKKGKPVSCTLIYKGKKLHYDDIGKSPFKETKWWYKYLYFREIQISSPNRCRW